MTFVREGQLNVVLLCSFIQPHVARQTVVDFERGARTPHPNNLSAIRAALEAAGVEFIDENGGGAGVRLRKG
jgi:hypothetical protein